LTKPSYTGYLTGSFRALRDLTRYREAVIEERARETQRLHKVLEDADVKLSSVSSAVLNKSGRAMIDALVAGERDPEVHAEMALGRLRKKIPELQRALAGRFKRPPRLVVAGDAGPHRTRPMPPSQHWACASTSCWPPTERRCRCW